jgi:hypothetical protein
MVSTPGATPSYDSGGDGDASGTDSGDSGGGAPASKTCKRLPIFEKLTDAKEEAAAAAAAVAAAAQPKKLPAPNNHNNHNVNAKAKASNNILIVHSTKRGAVCE